MNADNPISYDLSNAVSFQARYQTWLRWYPQEDNAAARRRFSMVITQGSAYRAKAEV